ncbi:MAG TPA: universal stress protein [Burkholderiales bacterium]|nr:universal stress protein [Burkholderiales bacterium]
MSDGFGLSGTGVLRDVVRPVPNAGATPIERLILVSSSGEGRGAPDKRAELIAAGAHPRPTIVRPAREDDVLALTKASDLVLVERRKPLPFIVPYLDRAARGLLRKSAAPLLVVAGIPQSPYERVLVATDLQTDITGALAAVKAIAPNAAVTLLHVYRALFDGKLQWAGVPEADIAPHRVDAQREAARGMAALLDRHSAINPARTLVRYGWPVPGVLRTLAELDADLIVVVRNTQSWWADVLGASVSHDLAQRADRDVLVVRAPVSRAG